MKSRSGANVSWEEMFQTRTNPQINVKKILPRPSANHKIAVFKSHVKCHCPKSASINADIVKCKVA